MRAIYVALMRFNENRVGLYSPIYNETESLAILKSKFGPNIKN